MQHQPRPRDELEALLAPKASLTSLEGGTEEERVAALRSRMCSRLGTKSPHPHWPPSWTQANPFTSLGHNSLIQKVGIIILALFDPPYLYEIQATYGM